MASATDTPPAPAEATSPVARVLKEALGGEVLKVEEFRGDLAITVVPSAWVRAATLLKTRPELDFKLFLDLCAVDHLDDEDRPKRFEVVLHVYSVSGKHHARLKVGVSEANPRLPTLTGVYRGANWFEREAWDLYGIVFERHPNLTRILTHHHFVGHPMRKDYPTAQRHVLPDPQTWLLKVPEGSEHLVVNIGPSHPAMHGTFRVQALMDGETITDAAAEIGYMHRNFEKMAEVRTYWQIIPYTDRLNYCSSFMNGHGWALAVEKLMGVQPPARAEAMRVILSELSPAPPPKTCSPPAGSRTWARCRRKRPSTGAGSGRACAAPGWPTTSARTTPTPATSSTTSTCRWARSAIATTATSSGWRRSGRACASSSRRWPSSPGDR